MLRGLVRRFLDVPAPAGDQYRERPTISSPWEDPYWYEPEVTLLLRDALRPGDIFFDVGANIGGISSIASFLTGPKGQVFAFEGSPRVMPELMRNLTYARANNVFVLHALVSSAGGQTAPIFYGSSNVADTMLGAPNRAADAFVETVAIDEVCKKYEVMPDVVKMDIEGPEYLALQGSKSLLERRVPFVLEVNPKQSAAADLLSSCGYLAIDLATMARHVFDGSSTGSLRNVLFLHQTYDGPLSDYALGCTLEEVGFIDITATQSDVHGLYVVSQAEFGPGRYFLQAQLTGASQSNPNGTVGVSAWAGGKQVVLSICSLSSYLANYTSIPFHMKHRGNLTVRLTYDADALRGWVGGFRVMAMPR